MGAEFAAFPALGTDLRTFLAQTKRNRGGVRYAEHSCLGGPPLFPLLFDRVNSGRFRTTHFRETNSHSLFLREYQ